MHILDYPIGFIGAHAKNQDVKFIQQFTPIDRPLIVLINCFVVLTGLRRYSDVIQVLDGRETHHDLVRRDILREYLDNSEPKNPYAVVAGGWSVYESFIQSIHERDVHKFRYVSAGKQLRKHQKYHNVLRLNYTSNGMHMQLAQDILNGYIEREYRFIPKEERAPDPLRGKSRFHPTRSNYAYDVRSKYYANLTIPEYREVREMLRLRDTKRSAKAKLKVAYEIDKVVKTINQRIVDAGGVDESINKRTKKIADYSPTEKR